jgi:uncharacterized protein
VRAALRPVISPVPFILSFSRRHRIAVLSAALCLGAVAAWGARGLTFDTDVLGLLPRDGRVVPAFRTFVRTFGSVDDLYVVFTAPEGRAIEEYRDVIDAWAAKLRHVPGIARVDAGLFDGSRNLNWLADRRLLLLSKNRLDEALSRFQGAGMRTALGSRRNLLSLPSSAVADLVRNDPLGLFDLLRDELGRAQAGLNIGIAEGGHVSADGRSRLLVAGPERPPFDAEFSRGLMSRMEELRREMGAPRDASGEDRPLPYVQFAGGHRIAVETASVIRRESIMTTAGSLALILPLLFLIFRSGWLVAVGAIPSSLSLLVTLGALGMTGATLSAAATASSAMLFGLGIDGVVLLYVGYTLAVRDGGEPAAAIDGLAGPAASMLLGMWTTAATFYGLRFVDFPSLEQLGTLIGHSMVLCGLLTLTLVAALLPRRRPKRPPRSLSMPRFARWVNARSGSILAAALVATMLLGAAATRVRINPTLDRLRSVTPGAELLQRIGPMFGLPDDVYVVLAEGADLEQLLQANERLRADLARTLPGIGIHAPSALLPSAETQATRLARIAKTSITVDAASRALDAAEAAEGFKPGSFDPFRARLAAVLDPQGLLTFDGYLSQGLGDLVGRFVARDGTRWRLVTYVFPSGPDQAASLAARVAAVDPDVTVTGLPLVNRELADRFMPAFARGLGIGTAVVIALVLAAFRSWKMSLMSLAPTAVGMVWAAGALALAGIALDLFALFAVVTFVGIGVDYGVHVVHRYGERANARQAIEELAPVILVAAAITILGYGTLTTSSYPPLRSIGLVSAVGVAALAIASLLVLPALLCLAERGERA